MSEKQATVFVVLNYFNDTNTIMGIFSTQEKAEKVAKYLYEVIPYQIDVEMKIDE